MDSKLSSQYHRTCRIILPNILPIHTKRIPFTQSWYIVGCSSSSFTWASSWLSASLMWTSNNSNGYRIAAGPPPPTALPTELVQPQHRILHENIVPGFDRHVFLLRHLQIRDELLGSFLQVLDLGGVGFDFRYVLRGYTSAFMNIRPKFSSNFSLIVVSCIINR